MDFENSQLMSTPNCEKDSLLGQFLHFQNPALKTIKKNNPAADCYFLLQKILPPPSIIAPRN